MSGLGIGVLTGSFIPILIAGIASVLLALTVATGHGDELIAEAKDVLEGFKEFFVGVFTGDIEKSISGIGKAVDGLKGIVIAVISGVSDAFNSFLTWLDEKAGGKLHGIIESVDKLKGRSDYKCPNGLLDIDRAAYPASQIPQSGER